MPDPRKPKPEREREEEAEGTPRTWLVDTPDQVVEVPGVVTITIDVDAANVLILYGTGRQVVGLFRVWSYATVVPEEDTTNA